MSFKYGNPEAGELAAGGIGGMTVALNSAMPAQYDAIMLPECGTAGSFSI